jgi:hypothetical protein
MRRTTDYTTPRQGRVRCSPGEAGQGPTSRERPGSLGERGVVPAYCGRQGSAANVAASRRPIFAQYIISKRSIRELQTRALFPVPWVVL